MPLPLPMALALVLTGLSVPAAPTAEAHDFAPQRGIASYYHPHRFTGRTMANGERFNPRSNSAAHRTLPLGTEAMVTNLNTGESRRVVIEDRGPHIRGRIIDVSPRIAEELGMRGAGLARVEIRPLGEDD
ncbi:septal ring lytic transglycosylase RlpA family protein [Falsiroseomonas sp. E2-1-a20]|uniref:septal ring lytic transglycosylase RlpA family protein n=1 Tax=Falsiroseomonas sp. E2-1-a20 TaxID=3239300 RepID=UPI003F408510